MEEKLGYNVVMYNTNWQDEIFKTRVGTNTNFSARGKMGDFTCSFYCWIQQHSGLLKTSGYQRANGSVALNPTFFNNTLKVG